MSLLLVDTHVGTQLFYSLTIRLEEMAIKRRGSEQWMRRRLPPQDIQEHVRRHDQYKRYALLKHKLLSQEWTISTKGSRSSNSSELQPTQHTTFDKNKKKEKNLQIIPTQILPPSTRTKYDIFQYDMFQLKPILTSYQFQPTHLATCVFLLTPKLLSDLEYGEACTILTIMNGLWMDEPSEVSVADIKVKG
ncbi:hypothetical protein Tco_0392876 [Tanacetum coccineum]